MNLLENLHNHKLPANQVFVAIQNAFLCPTIRLFIAEAALDQSLTVDYLFLDNMQMLRTTEWEDDIEQREHNVVLVNLDNGYELRRLLTIDGKKYKVIWKLSHDNDPERNKQGNIINKLDDIGLVIRYGIRGQHGLKNQFTSLVNRKFKDIENLPNVLKKAAKQINDLELDTSKPQTISTYLAWQENANKILREYWPRLSKSNFNSYEDMIQYLHNQEIALDKVEIRYFEQGYYPDCGSIRLCINDNKKIRYLDNGELEEFEDACERHFVHYGNIKDLPFEDYSWDGLLKLFEEKKEEYDDYEEDYEEILRLELYEQNKNGNIYSSEEILNYEGSREFITAREINEYIPECVVQEKEKGSIKDLLRFQENANCIIQQYWPIPSRDQKWPVNVFENPKAKEPEMER